MQSQTRILRQPGVTDATGLAKPTIYALIAKGMFPKPIQLTGRAVGWLESEVDAWKAERIAQRDSKAA